VANRVTLPSSADRWPQSGCIIDGQAYLQRWPAPRCPRFAGPGRTWPTAATRDWKGAPSTLTRASGQSRLDQLDRVAERLWWPLIGEKWFQQWRDGKATRKPYVNPAFASWMMGFHPEWTDL
jgi:hypothetical protein